MNWRTVKWLYHGNYEAAERIAADVLLQRGDRVVEAGAGMGLISMTAARIVGADHIVSYEPMPLAFSILEDNLRLNELAIEVRKRALGAKSSVTPFYVQAHILSSSCLPAAQQSERIDVAVDGIADVLAETGANVLILDAEGAEVEIIKACPLAQIDKILMEVHPELVGAPAIAEIFTLLKNAGLAPQPALQAGRVMAFARSLK